MIPFYFLVVVLALSHLGYAQEAYESKLFQLPANALKVNGNTEVNPLVKPLKLVTVLDPKGPSIDRELEVWNGLMGSMDRDSIGYIFLVQDTEDIEPFKQYWFSDRNMDYPFYYDTGKKVIEANGLSVDSPGQTLLLDDKNAIILSGGSPINTDPYNRYRSELYQRTLEMGMDKAVRGVIVEHTERGIKWFYASEPVYVTEQGEVIPKNQADAGIRSKKWVPGTSPLSDTIRLVNRHP
ncbi:hypothetical protein [Cyclobacterium jeungdonense]|uniref:Uncharacterized protein n=1 Tax=Cyclobacterium jeungdonense TaxID=708087 RepID=A0ABT8C3S6_9BACT|nr:hypothetical protein [Cyclobacterium jeungdonense]MDN3687445.1 hypothetical protein [Cyclobacterium jeungdonense]